MQRKFTQNDLVRFLYGEMESLMSIQCMEWILGNEKVLQKFEYYAESKQSLDAIHFSPTEDSVARIRSFSASQKVGESV